MTQVNGIKDIREPLMGTKFQKLVPNLEYVPINDLKWDIWESLHGTIHQLGFGRPEVDKHLLPLIKTILFFQIFQIT